MSHHYFGLFMESECWGRVKCNRVPHQLHLLSRDAAFFQEFASRIRAVYLEAILPVVPLGQTVAPLLLPSRKGAQSCLPRQVYRRTQDRLSCGCTPVPRTSLTVCRTARLRLVAAGSVPSRLGRLRQTAFRRARTCAALSRCLHSSRRHLQQQVGCSLRGQRNLSLARLRSRQQEAADDSARR